LQGPEPTRALPPRADDPSKYLAGQRVDRYEVGERLGAGGMGEVYRAWDPLLRRTVALKRVAQDQLVGVDGREGLLHEARALSSLSHRAIASVYDVVESGGQLFIVEEFVSGTSLRARVGEPMELDAFYGIAEECLSALDEASRRGIVHCDIKPENIVLTAEGQPKILDFGLARRVSPDEQESTVATRWQATSVPRGGTTSYMAPEALVESRADARSDLWALGIVFYEMLAARHPFRRDTAAETATCILTEDPEPPGRHRAGVPPELDSLVMSMLAKRPDERSASATELLTALRAHAPMPAPPGLVRSRSRLRPVVTVVAAAAVAAGAWAAWEWRPAPAGSGPPVYLAVEPFESPGADAQAEFFALGFVDAATARAGTVERLHVVPPDVPFRPDATLRGDVQLVVDRIRVSYEVQGPGDAVTGGVVTGGVGEIFDLRDRLARNVSRILADRFGLDALPPEQASAPETTVDAYVAYLGGAGYLSRADEPGRAGDAVRLFGESVGADPAYLPARVGLAEALWRSGEAERALETARSVVEADPASALARRVRGRILFETGDVEAAEAELRLALELDPGDVEVSRLLSEAQRRLGRADDAVATLSRAAELHPGDWSAHRNLGMYLYQLGRMEEASVVCQRMLALTPGNARGKSTLGGIYFYLGRNADAIDAYLESIEIEPNHRAFSNIASVYMAERRWEDAATNLEAALELDETDYRVWINLVVVYENIPGREADVASSLEHAVARAEDRLRTVPDDAVALALVAGCYAAAGRPEDAEIAVERALAISPDDMDVLFHCAGACERLGDRARAIDLARRALEAGFPLRMMETESALRDLVASREFRRMLATVRPAGAET